MKNIIFMIFGAIFWFGCNPRLLLQSLSNPRKSRGAKNIYQTLYYIMSSFTEEVTVQPQQDVVYPEQDVVYPQQDVVQPQQGVVQPQQDLVLVDKHTPPPGLTEYAIKVKEIIESGHFQNDLLSILGSNKSMFMITNGGRKKSNRQGLIRRSTIKRKQKGGEKWLLTQLMIGIFIGTAMMKIGQVDFGQVMEWIRTNPNFYYTSIFSAILAKFPQFAREHYLSAIKKKMIDMISSDLFLIGSVTKLYNMLSFTSEGIREDVNKCVRQISNRVENSQTNVFNFVNDSFGSIQLNLNCAVNCR